VASYDDARKQAPKKARFHFAALVDDSLLDEMQNTAR
jgi:hypothetical protein